MGSTTGHRCVRPPPVVIVPKDQLDSLSGMVRKVSVDLGLDPPLLRAAQAQVDAVRAEHPDARLTIWAEDEHRLRLLPVVRRVGAPRGQRHIAWVRHRDL